MEIASLADLLHEVRVSRMAGPSETVWTGSLGEGRGTTGAMRLSDELENWLRGDADKTLGGLIDLFGDGVALKQAVDAWVDAAPADAATRFGNAETVLWMVWGVQSFSYAVYGLTLVLLGVAVAVSRRFGAWIGSVAVAAGSLSLAIGIDIAYRGSETGFYELSSVAYQLLVLVFVVGILIAEVRPRARPSMVSAP